MRAYVRVWRRLLFCGCVLTLSLFVVSPLLAQVQPDAGNATAVALDRRFTYQGRLDNGSDPFSGVCDLRFTLYNGVSGSSQVGAPHTVNNVPIAAGVFVVTLNSANQFGDNAFNGEQRWLEIAVRCPAGSGQFAVLSPRQPLNVTPNAAFALHAATATNAANVPWSGVSGVPANILNPPTYTAGPGLQLTGGQFSVAFGGSGAATTVARSDHTHFGQSWSGSHPAAGLTITNTAEGQGVYGVFGMATSSTGVNYGVFGRSNSIAGRGVFGVATAASGTTYGVWGLSYSTGGKGVFGWANADSGTTYGVWGESSSTEGRGVFGTANAASGTTYGVRGQSNSTQGRGVFGMANAASGITYGVSGQSASTEGRGVFGWANAASGETYGVYGLTTSTDGRGVYGLAYADSGFAEGVWGESSSTAGRGVVGWATATTGTTYGVYGLSNSTHGIGVFGWANPESATNFAGSFIGRLSATGTKTFRIDHPLDPANKILNHAAIESSEQLNVYSGNVILDGSGSAEVVMPAWFSALNTDFRYQLTAIGTAAPGLYIAAKIQDNRFRIGGGAPGMEVSWQVTGVRHDPTALYYPLVVEEDKPEADRGTYLTPAAFGQPVERGTHYQLLQMDELKRDSVAHDELLRDELHLDRLEMEELQREHRPDDLRLEADPPPAN